MKEINNILNKNFISTQNLTISGYHLIEIFIIVGITVIFLRLIKKILGRQVDSQRLELSTSYYIFQIIRYFLWILAIFLILDIVFVKITILLAGSAALLVGLGFGLQEIFRDLVSGIFMLFEANLKVDDVIELNDGMIGKVIEIGLRTTKIETRDKVILIIPNSQFISERLINWSHNEKTTRFFVEVGVAYGSDVDKVTEILELAANEHPKVAKSPKPHVMFVNFGDSSLDFKLQFWVVDTFWVERIKSDLRYAINRKFIENNIQIPFPQRDVHIRKENG